MSRAVSYLKAERSGRFAETAALLLLLCKGYWPLAQRVKTPRGEIDLIVRRGRTLALVEVKRRAVLDSGLSAVSAGYTVRCDVVVSAPKRLPHHISNAFSA
jgi:putative endonuclease